MREVVVYELLSLDGVAEAPDQFITDWDDDLKDRPGGDIGVRASISVVQTLLAADVVDRVRLVVAPWIVGGGRRLLDGLPATPLEMTQGVQTPTGHLLLDYRLRR